MKMAKDHTREATERCERVLVTLLGSLGPWRERIFLVGGLAPRYLVGQLPKGMSLVGRPFRIFKFRTMIPDAENFGLGLACASDDERVTRVGRWLRRTSLDELPQLINVALGDMNLIGPRPTVRAQVDQYTRHQRRRLEVKPGLTGWAQVNGRNALSWEERIELDIWYVDHRSPMLDLWILLRTPWAMIESTGIYGRGGVTQDLSRDSENDHVRGSARSLMTLSPFRRLKSTRNPCWDR